MANRLGRETSYASHLGLATLHRESLHPLFPFELWLTLEIRP